MVSPDSLTVVSTSSDGTLRLWSVATQRELALFWQKGRGFDRPMFSKDGRVLAAGSGHGAGGQVQIWRAPSWEEIDAIEKARPAASRRLRATNAKLLLRAQRLTMQATGCSADDAERTLAACDYRIKVAIVALKRGIDARRAERLLQAHGGSVHLHARPEGGLRVLVELPRAPQPAPKAAPA